MGWGGGGGGESFGKGFLFWTELPHFFHKHVNNFSRDPFLFCSLFSENDYGISEGCNRQAMDKESSGRCKTYLELSCCFVYQLLLCG